MTTETTFGHCWSTRAVPVAPGSWYLRPASGFRPSREHAHWQLLHSGPHSRIYRVEGASPCIAKVIIPRSQPRDSLRKYAASQAWREARGNRTLAAIGLDTVPILGWGVALSPLADFESVLFMRPLPAFTSALWLIRTCDDDARRAAFLRELAHQIARMLGHGIIHKDAHFDNLCITRDNRMIWIDNDIRRPATLRKRREGLKKMLALLATTARDDLTADEWRLFERELGACLPQWPQGNELADEIR